MHPRYLEFVVPDLADDKLGARAALASWATVVAAKAAVPEPAAAEVVAARQATGLAAALRLGLSDHPSISKEQ